MLNYGAVYGTENELADEAVAALSWWWWRINY